MFSGEKVNALPSVDYPLTYIYIHKQTQKAVSAHFTSNQILPFGFAEHYTYTYTCIHRAQYESGEYYTSWLHLISELSRRVQHIAIDYTYNKKWSKARERQQHRNNIETDQQM